MPERTIVTAGRDDAGKRIDRVIRRFLPDVPLSRIYAAFRKKEIRLRGSRARPEDRVREGDSIEIDTRLLSDRAATSAQEGSGDPNPSADPNHNARTEFASFQDMIVYENEHILALSKPRGVLVHAGDEGERSGTPTLERLVRAYLEPALSPSLSFRPGPMHRIDRNTTGLVFFSRSIEGARRFSALLSAGRIEKLYLAVLDGELTGYERWEDLLERDEARRTTRRGSGRGAKDGSAHIERGDANRGPKTGSGAEAEHARVSAATTECLPVLASRSATLCLLSIGSGRTHQIRAQAALHGHPLAGDAKYGGSPLRGGYLLHAWAVRLSEDDPILGFRLLRAPLPDRSRKTMERLFGERALDPAIDRLALDRGFRAILTPDQRNRARGD